MFETELFSLDRLHKLNIKPSMFGYGFISAGVIWALVGVFGYVRQVNSLNASYLLNLDLEKEGVFLTSSNDTAQIWVDVAGAVKHPGIYKLKFGDRVADAVSLAGGFSPKADKAYINRQLNLAQKLKDEAKIYIPFKGEGDVVGVVSGASLSQASLKNNWVEAGNPLSGLNLNSSEVVPASKVSLNQASKEDLESLSGIGPVRAEKIIQARPFQSLDELVTKKLVPSSVFNKIKANIVL